ncbi:MAG: cbb3-type cytochrome c oxidase subunit I, partial [Pseudomonadota bacterium]|nr:cbb3-type cytochrome c oxidase subunit I [Pseudomonadota bacterium]
KWGKAAFWLWFIGFYTAFMPLYVLGLLGMTRRMQHYDRPDWYPWLVVAGIGALIILAGIFSQIMQLYVSIRDRDQRRDTTGDPWGGHTLEWATASPPPKFNFAVLPDVAGEEPYFGMKARATQEKVERYEPIEMPLSSATGFVTAFFATATGFALIWHIWWLVGMGLLGAYVTFVIFAWRNRDEITIPAEEAARLDRANREARRQQEGVPA